MVRWKWLGLGAVLLFAIPHVGLAKPKTKLVVQLYAQELKDIAIIRTFTLYLVLSDGSHAKAECTDGYDKNSPCLIEPLAAEKRVASDCGVSPQNWRVLCLKEEFYYSDRKANDIVIYAPNGKKTYHVIGSWAELPFTTVPSKQYPKWTAHCSDGTYSYSETRSGTCSDHGGVVEWGRPPVDVPQ